MVLALFSELWCLTPQSFGGDQVAVLVLEMMQVQAPWEDNAQELWLLLAIKNLLCGTSEVSEVSVQHSYRPRIYF